MIGFNFSVDIDSARKEVEASRLKAYKAATEGIHTAGLFVQGEVQSSIAGQRAEPRSVDTGHFMQTVETDNTKELESEIKSMVDYSQYLEDGTSRIQPRRHFANSIARNQDKVREYVEKAIHDVI